MEDSIRKLKLYFAAPLFNTMERRFNLELTNKLSRFFEVYLPQREGGLMDDMIKQGIKKEIAAEKVYKADIDALEQCDIILIILDGRTIDEGAAFELGYAYAFGKSCFGYQTDVRRLLKTGNNPMIDSSLKKIFNNENDLLEWAVQYNSCTISKEFISDILIPINNK